MYYWAHYDFFNNTKLGEAVPGKKCDEVFASWKQTKGWLRSPLNTLIYKQQHTNEDVTCLYRFVTDKRLFARVILTITCVNFKVGRSTSFINLQVSTGCFSNNDSLALKVNNYNNRKTLKATCASFVKLIALLVDCDWSIGNQLVLLFF